MSYQSDPGGINSKNLGEVVVGGSNYTVQADDYAVICNNTAVIVITLPVPEAQRQIVIKRSPASTDTVNLSGTVNNVVGTYSLSVAEQTAILVSDGATWWVIN